MQMSQMISDQGGIRGSSGVCSHAGEGFGRGESPPGGANILLDIRPGANYLRPHRGASSKTKCFVECRNRKAKTLPKKNRSER